MKVTFNYSSTFVDNFTGVTAYTPQIHCLPNLQVSANVYKGPLTLFRWCMSGQRRIKEAYHVPLIPKSFLMTCQYLKVSIQIFPVPYANVNVIGLLFYLQARCYSDCFSYATSEVGLAALDICNCTLHNAKFAAAPQQRCNMS